MNFVYVPIDSRACNNLFPMQLAKLQGIEVTIPSKEIMDDFMIPSNYDSLKKWLYETCSDDTVLILSVDNFTMGSLLNSRCNSVSIETCMERMDEVKELKSKYPGMKIYAFNVLMRTSISTLSTASIENWNYVNEYSQLVHKAELYHREEDRLRISELEALIPSKVLETYLYSRKKNALVNKMSVEFVNEGIFHCLSILQEDSTPYGMQKKEQVELSELIRNYGLQEKISLHNGTDEAGCLCMAKAIADYKGIKTKLSYVYLNDNRDSFVASYEDRLFHENLLSQSKFAGIELVDGGLSLEDVLVIYTPVNRQYEASVGNGTPPCDYSPETLNAFAKRVVELIDAGKRVYFLDVAYANGGQGDILHRIHKLGDVTKLWGYSAWNTASNALGTILSQVVLATEAEEEENRRFTLERFLDDFAYQGIVRQQLKTELDAKGEDTLNLKEKKVSDKILSQLMEVFVKKDPIFQGKQLELSCELPWARIFEANILIKKVV
ncbi:DUF4127 family protein [Lachnoclostridium phytofermentans]|uniref:DUF4127 domain-containing protein n=1 Tax=Lachnoclostridium phytofermentans (strain ATCC 700394 / DSM 18823 / ISDg) TaxID=357809 RepID=A9KRV4_LACP7|nr:DUF4127 family protein [Lachnoclostridium phytofermentans]ABX43598.1 conserved hypothetical protein [Lachnoclostridium phytofermentans ISDg]